jgi:hypothetical protein
MTEVDPRFGNPRNNTDVQSNELSHASDEIFNEWTKGIRNSFSSFYALSERISDQSAALMASSLGTNVALDHCKEIEQVAQQAIANNNGEGAKHLFKRDLAFSMWTLGFDDQQTQSIKKQLDQLENPTLNSTQPVAGARVKDFGDIFRSH